MRHSIFHDASWLRFLLVGGLCFVLNLLILFVGTDLLGAHYLWATLVSLWMTSTLGWQLNRCWTFGSRSSAWLAEYGRYLTVSLSSFGLGLGLMAVCVSGLGMHYLVANAVISAGLTVANFLTHRNWSFDSRC